MKNAEQFTSVGQILLDRLVLLLKETDTAKEKDVAVLKRMLEVVAVVCGVRSGSRLTGKFLSSLSPSWQVTNKLIDNQKSMLFSQLSHLPILPEMHTTLLRYLTPLFFAGDMSLWLGPGLKFLQHVWSPTAVEGTANSQEIVPFTETQLSFTLKFNLCLADAGWGGWKLVASPVLLKSMTKTELGLIDKEQRRLIAFLAALQREKKLAAPGDLDLVWRRKIQAVILQRLADGAWKEECSDDMVPIPSPF